MYNYTNPNYNQYPNNYNNYQPSYINTQQRLNQLQQYQQYQNQQNIPNQNVTWIQVNGINGAKEHIVQPNQTAWLMDNNDSVFFVKSADNLGVTTLKCYKFFEIDTKNINSNQTNDYVSMKDFNELQNRIIQLETYISNINISDTQYDKSQNTKQQTKK